VRDGQKWLAPWLVLLAIASALGARRVARAAARRSQDALVRRTVLVAVLLLPVVTLPDLMWGALGRLASVDYPPDWEQAREVLTTDPAPGDVVSLPWSTFRRFDWNLGRTVLDPAPRAMPRTVVTDTSLVVRRNGELVVVPGDDARSTVVGEAVRTGVALGPVLRAEGIGWALVERSGGPATSTVARHRTACPALTASPPCGSGTPWRSPCWSRRRCRRPDHHSGPVTTRTLRDRRIPWRGLLAGKVRGLVIQPGGFMPAIVAIIIAIVIGLLAGIGGAFALTSSQGGGSYPEQAQGAIVVYGTS
jgi:hypothetical protein